LDHTVVDHARPRCESHEFYHGILSGNARGVFNGKIFVRQDAQKTNAKQNNRNLLLSDEAVRRLLAETRSVLAMEPNLLDIAAPITGLHLPGSQRIFLPRGKTWASHSRFAADAASATPQWSGTSTDSSSTS